MECDKMDEKIEVNQVDNSEVTLKGQQTINPQTRSGKEGEENAQELTVALVKDDNEERECDKEKEEIEITGTSGTVFLCYKVYKNALEKILARINMFYGTLGGNIARHPALWIIISLTCVSICCLGFLRWKTEHRTEELYVPDDTESEKVLSKTRPYFKTFHDFREEEIIFRPNSGGNILKPKCVEEAKALIRDIFLIKGFKSYCLPKPSYMKNFQQYDSSHNCSVLNPLELIKTNYTSLQDINYAMVNKLILMSNGKIPHYNQPEMLGMTQKTAPHMSKIGAIRIVLFMVPSENVKVWEREYIQLLEKRQKNLECSSIFYSAQRSIDDAITESTSADVNLVSVSFLLMIMFACATMGKLRNPIRGHSLLAYFGIFSTSLGIAGGMGFVLLIGFPYVSIVGILIFLTLSIGVDDMFIIIDEYDKHITEKDPVERVSKTLRSVGATITMTTLTDIVAFAVSTLSDFPAVRYFCTYAAVTFAVEFLLQIILFVAFLSYDARRIKAQRRDCLPCCKSVDQNTCLERVDENFAPVLMRKYANLLVKWPSKVIVFMISGGMLAGGIYGCFHVSQEFSRTTLVPDGSYYLHYVNVLENEFKLSLPINLVKLGKDNYSNPKVQSEIDEAISAAISTNYYLPQSLSWLHVYRQWASSNPNLNIKGENFMKLLPTFLSFPAFAHFQSDVILNSDNEIEASRSYVFLRPIWKSTFLRDSMINTRKEFKERNIDIIPITGLYMHFEQFAAVVGEVTRNVCLTAGAVLLMALPFCISPVVVLFLLLSFVLLITNLVGLMYLWDISVSGVSMMNLVISVGFAVDYSAHIAYAFVMSKQKKVDEKVIDSLSTVGASVLMGGLSTFTGMLITFLGSSELFRIFFRMLFGIVVISLFHGLVFLPTLFSTFGFLV